MWLISLKITNFCFWTILSYSFVVHELLMKMIVASVPNVIQVAAMRISIEAWSFYNVILWDQLRKAWNTVLYDIRYSLIGLQKSVTNCNKPFSCFMACNADGVGGDQLIAFCRYIGIPARVSYHKLLSISTTTYNLTSFIHESRQKRRPLCTHPIPAFLHLNHHTQNSLNFRHKIVVVYFKYLFLGSDLYG